MFLEYTANCSDEGKTVKQIIGQYFALSSRTLSRLKNDGGIKVDGNTVTVRHIMKQAETLTLYLCDKPSENIEKVNIPLDILYEDEHLLLVNKPYAMPIHPSQGHHSDTLANAVMYRYRDTDFTFRAITRLDGDTTGVVLVARNALCAQRLTDFLGTCQIKKEYLAVVLGIPVHSKGTIDAPIARYEDSIIKRKIDACGKSAVTEYETVFSTPDKKYSLVRAFPITGRTHQIRLHMSHIGNPLYGDFLYGIAIDNVRAYLHCASLTFPHPITKKIIKIEAPMPEDMKTILGI